MEVKILKTINGFKNDILSAGKTVVLTEAQAKPLILSGLAEEVKAKTANTSQNDGSDIQLKREKLDKNGNPIKEKGQIVYEFLKLDADGKAVIDADGNPVYGEE